MKVLAIDTSTSRGNAAFLDGETIVAERQFTAERGHNAALFEPLGELLEAAGAFELIVVGTGPGSYGGVRVGIAAANALGLARAVPVIGLPSLLAPDEHDEADYHVVSDARRGSFMLAAVSGRRLAGEPELIDEDDLVRALGALRAREAVLTFDEKPLPLAMERVRVARPSAVRLARLAQTLSPEEREAIEAAPLEPMYLRAPFITQPKR